MTASSTSAVATKVHDASLVSRVRDMALAHPIWTVFLLALVVRTFIAVVLTKYFSGTLVLDDTTYHFMAEQMSLDQTGSWDQFTFQLFYSTASFMLPITALYRVFGPEPIVGQLFVVVMGTFAAVFTTRIALEFLSQKLALVVGIIVALLPSQAFWSSMLMKDASVWFALTGLGAVVAVASRSTGRRLAMLAVPAGGFLVMLSYLRLHTLVVAVWALMIAVFFGVKQDRIARIAGAVVLGVSIPWIFGAIGPAGFSLITHHGSLEERRFLNAQGANTAIVEGVIPPPLDQLPTLEEAQAQIVRLEREAVAIEAENPDKAKALRDRAQVVRDTIPSVASIPPPAPSDSTGSLTPEIGHLPRGLSVMLIEPLPLPFTGSLSLRLARAEALFWYPLLILAAIGLWRVRPYLRQMLFPLLMGAGIVVIYALSEGNVGTAHRHRGEFVWVVALLATTGLAHIVQSRRTISEEAA